MRRVCETAFWAIRFVVENDGKKTDANEEEDTEEAFVWPTLGLVEAKDGLIDVVNIARASVAEPFLNDRMTQLPFVIVSKHKKEPTTRMAGSS